MMQYDLLFAKYALRPHERALGLMELNGLLPQADIVVNNKDKVVLETSDPHALEKLRKLTFFSYIRNGGNWESTVQHKLETLDGGKHSTRNIRYFSHGLHEYKGRFYPQLGRALMNTLRSDQGVALDPFCGCGTLLLEAELNDATAIGVDINPIGWMIARAKIASLHLSEKSIEKMYRAFTDIASSVAPLLLEHDDANLIYLKRWFPESNLRNFLQLDKEIRASFSGNSRLFLQIILSESLKRFSWQAPNEQRIRRRKDTPPENVREFFCQKLFAHLDRILALRQMRRWQRPKAKARLGDARYLPVETESIDCVVTSPPYATALPYIDANRLSLFFFRLVDRRKFVDLEKKSIGSREISTGERLTWEKRITNARNSEELPTDVLEFLDEVHTRNKCAEVGFRRRNTAALLCKYFIDMRDALIEMHRVLKPKGRIALVVGNNFTVAGDKHMEIPTAEFINLIAEQNNFSRQHVLPITIPTAYNIYSRNAIRSESISILQRI